MMLEVDIESNRILVTEPLLVAPQATDDNDDRGRTHRTTGRAGYDSSYVIAHFLMGLVVLCILVVVVFRASQNSVNQSESAGSESGGGFANDTSTFAGILVGSFLDCSNTTTIIGVNQIK